MTIIRGKILIKVQNDIELSLSNEIFKNIISLPYKYFKNRTTGEVLTRINDLSIITDTIIKIIVTILLDLLLSIFACIFLFNINKSLFMISSVIIIFYILIVLKFQNKLKIKLEKIKEEKASLNSYIVENISGYETLKGLSIENNIINNYKMRNNKYIKLSKNYENIYNKENLLKNLLEEIGICILILVGSLLVIKKQITIGNLITFISLFSYYISPLKNIVDLNKDIKDAKISFNRLNEIIYDIKPTLTFLKLPFNNINIKNLTYSYDKYNIDLALTGHTHGGIVKLPVINGIYAHPQGWLPKYSYGIYKTNNFSMIISGGIGYSKLLIRIFNPPEICTITLERK